MGKTISRNDFLKQLYSYCEGQIELRALPSRRQAFYGLAEYKAIDAFCQTYKNENVYFAVATRNGGGTKEHIKHIPAVWIDIDFKDIKKPLAEQKIRNFQVRPTLVVASGGGFHVYYKLKEPYEKSDIPQIEALNQALARSLNGDLNACDASRILRLPDTTNQKYKPPVKVSCVFQLNAEYDLTDFDFLKHESLYSNNITNNYIHKYVDNTEELGDTRRHSATFSDIGFGEGKRDASLFHLANHLVKGGMPPVSIEKYLQFIGKHCSPPFPEKEIETKVKSALVRSKRVVNNLAEEIIEWVQRQPGDFSATFCDKELDLATSSDMKNRAKILERLVSRGIIERYGTRRGWYRLVNTECDEINFMDVDAESLAFKWPLSSLESMIEIYPGNIIVIAGEPNVGKSAFMLSFTQKNMVDHKIHYFSSEMGSIELRKRLMQFETPLADWCFFPKERSDNFADVVEPNAVNIIDYLEIHDNFYEVGGKLKAIHDKLDNGVALIALQKNKFTDFGLGGMRGLEKPRLYLAMSSEFPGGRAKIVKCKNWATTINPNGYFVKFKLLSGCHFIEQHEWTREEPTTKKG